MKLKRIFTLLLAGLLALSLTACGDGIDAGSPSRESSSSIASSGVSTSSDSHEANPRGLTLRVGKDGKFTDYPWEYTGKLNDAGVVPPAEAIAALGELTGWDLSLADEVTDGKGGMTVTFAKSCAIFTGPPEQQKEEFHMYDAEQLAETILDSIQKTLQEGFTLEGGDPDALDIWYYTEGTKPLELSNPDLSWPIDQPYQWTGAERGN